MHQYFLKKSHLQRNNLSKIFIFYNFEKNTVRNLSLRLSASLIIDSENLIDMDSVPVNLSVAAAEKKRFLMFFFQKCINNTLHLSFNERQHTFANQSLKMAIDQSLLFRSSHILAFWFLVTSSLQLRDFLYNVFRLFTNFRQDRQDENFKNMKMTADFFVFWSL